MMEAAPPRAFEIRAFRPDDEPEVHDLLQAGFGNWPTDMEGVAAPEFFRWKHLKSPFGPSILLVAEAAGAVIGFGAWMPWELRARGRPVHAMRGVDLVVHPAHRGGGIAVALIRSAAEYFSGDAAFTFSNPNEYSRPSILRSGRRRVGKLPSFVRPRRPLASALRLAFGKSKPCPAVEAVTAAEALRDAENVSMLLGLTDEPGGRLATVKNLQYLRWRYGEFEQYRAVRADGGSSLGGMAIFRLRRHGAVWVSRVCELLVARNDGRMKRDLLRQVIEAAPADFFACQFPSRHDAALCGFVQSPRGSIVMAYPLREDLVCDPTRRSSWALSQGDLELL